MMRIVGIDLGSNKVKIVEFESLFRRFDIHDFYEKSVPAGQSPHEVAAQMLRSLPKKPDKIVVSIPSHQLTFRNIRVPTRVKKEILNTIEFELEDDLPFKIDDTAFDAAYLAQDKAGTHVHVAATLKRYLAEYIFKLEDVGISPDVITTEPWAYRTFFNHMLDTAETDAPVILINFGKQQTTLYVHWKGYPVLIRHVSWGGDHLTRAIAKKYRIKNHEAEKAKIESGFILSEAQRAQATPEQRAYSDILRNTMDSLFLSIKQTFLSCKAECGENPAQLFVCGGSALLPGMTKIIRDETGVPTEMLKGLTTVSKSEISYSKSTDVSFVLAAGLGLGLIGPERARLLNFRKGEFGKANDGPGIDFSKLRGVFIGTGAVLASLLISLLVQNLVFKSEIEDIDARLRRNVRSFFGGSISPSAMRSYLQSPSRLKKAVEDELKKQRELAQLFTKNPQSPTALLKNVSDKIPKSVTVDLINFQTGAAPTQNYDPKSPRTTEMVLLLDSSEDANKLTGLLKPLFNELKLSDVKEVPSPYGEGKKWEVTLTGVPTEVAYGK